MTWSVSSDAVMTRTHPRRLMDRWGCVFLGVGIMWFALEGHSFSAETTNPMTMSKTLIVLALDSTTPLTIHTKFLEHPPTIVINFPRQRVMGALPERSTIEGGAITTIIAQYETSATTPPKRFLESLQIGLTGPYQYRVESQGDRIIVEIRHPASVSSTSVEVGLKGGTIIGGVGMKTVNERFRAMQEALASATPTPWTFQMIPEPDRSTTASTTTPTAAQGAAAPQSSQGTLKTAQRSPAIAITSLEWLRPPPVRRSSPVALWVIFISGFIAAGVAGLWLLARQGIVADFLAQRTSGRGTNGRVASGVMLIDQLVWRAFEQQGYQLVIENELIQPPLGTLRIMMKDGEKSALLFVGNGPFFEKQTVERFVQAMRQASVERGFLVAAGSFTVPAQRTAKEHHVTLIGREQLTELLTLGARSEYFTRQLEQQHARLEEARETLRQYASELTTLRRQRNEASWYLGEERAKSAKLEADLERATQQLRQHEGELQRREQEAAALRKQWEESQWYLGESHAHVRHLDLQLTDLQDIAKRTEAAERERSDAMRSLAEEQTKREQLEQGLADLRQRIEHSIDEEQTLRAMLSALQQELSALRAYGERRTHARVRLSETQVELFNGAEKPIFSGSPRNLSANGIGLESDQELPALPSFRVRLNIPGRDPIESQAKQIWQRSSPREPVRYQSGYQLLKLSQETRDLMRHLIEIAHASSD